MRTKAGNLVQNTTSLSVKYWNSNRLGLKMVKYLTDTARIRNTNIALTLNQNKNGVTKITLIRLQFLILILPQICCVKKASGDIFAKWVRKGHEVGDGISYANVSHVSFDEVKNKLIEKYLPSHWFRLEAPQLQIQ